MIISCHGASQEVGRSAFLIQDANTRIALDYGIKLGDPEEPGGPPDFPLPIKGYLDAVILSHAHLDHCGGLPYLFSGRECPVFTTPPTIPISEILMMDTLKIAQQEHQTLPFNEHNVKNYMRNCRPTKYKNEKNVGTDFKFELMDAGHILGSAFVLIYGQKYKIAYTGDIKLEDTIMHDGAKWPKQKFNILIIEATYATDHPKRAELEKQFIDECKDALNKNMPVICPSFALGRSQELIALFSEYDLGAPVYLDGMGQSIAEIYLDHINYLRKGNSLISGLNKAIWVANPSTRKEALNEPSLIVTTSGMLSGGASHDYLMKLGKKKAAIFLTGFQVKGTPGNTLLNTGKYISNRKSLDLHHCLIKKFDFSAHAGISELKLIAKRSNPDLILAVHSERANAAEYKKQVEEEFGLQVIAPHFGQEINIEEFI